MQRSVSIINNSSQIVTASTLCGRARCRPTRIGLVGKLFSFFFVSNKVDSALEVLRRDESFHKVIQRNRRCSRVFFPSTILTYSICSIFIVIAMNEDALRNVFIDIASVIPSAVIGIVVHLCVNSLAVGSHFIEHRFCALPCRIVRQEDVEISNDRHRVFRINSPFFLHVRMGHNPEIHAIVFTNRAAGKAYAIGIAIQASDNARCRHASAVIASTVVDVVDEERSTVIRLCGAKVNHRPAISISLRECYTLTANHQICGSPTIRKLEVNLG